MNQQKYAARTRRIPGVGVGMALQGGPGGRKVTHGFSRVSGPPTVPGKQTKLGPFRQEALVVSVTSNGCCTALAFFGTPYENLTPCVRESVVSRLSFVGVSPAATIRYRVATSVASR